MALRIGQILELNSSAISAGTALADIKRIKGAFKVYTSTVLNSTSIGHFTDGQIVYVEDSGSLYKANITLADYVSTFSDSVTFSQFSFDSGSFASASFDSSTSSLTIFGQDIEGSTQTSMSIDLSSLEGGGGGGGGDITAVFTSDEGITGGTSSGNAVLELTAGNGVLLNTTGINVNTGSTHFIEAVKNIELDGGTY